MVQCRTSSKTDVSSQPLLQLCQGLQKVSIPALSSSCSQAVSYGTSVMGIWCFAVGNVMGIFWTIRKSRCVNLIQQAMWPCFNKILCVCILLVSKAEYIFFLQCKGATPLKILTIGNVSTPLMCLNESSCLSEKNVIWGGCGTKIIALTSDFSVQKLIETKTSQL